MPQLNVLPISVSQHVESTEENARFSSTEGNEEFSQLIDQHLATSHEKSNAKKDEANTSTENSRHNDNAQHTTKSANQSKGRELNKDDISGDVDKTSEQQEVAASGNNGQESDKAAEQQALSESEQLMSFLHKADSTLLNDTQSSHKDVAPLSAEQKALYETKLLLNSSNLVADLSGVAKALSAEQIEQQVTQSVIDKKQLLSSESKHEKADKGIAKLPVEPFVEGKSEEVIWSEQRGVKTTGSADTLTESEQAQLIKSKSEQKVTAINASVLTPSEESNGQKSSQNHTEQDLDSKIKTSGLSGNATPTSSVNNATDPRIESIKNAKNPELIEVQKTAAIKIATDAASQFEQAQSALSQKVEALAQAKQQQNKESLLSADKQLKTNFAESTIQDSTEAVSDGSDVNIEQALVSENESKVAIANNQVATSNQVAGKTAINSENTEQSRSAAADVQKMKHTNQAVKANEVIAQQENNAQKQDVSQLSEQEQLAAKKQAVVTEEVAVPDKTVKNVKAEVTANTSFTDVSSRATQVAQQAQEQQSIELLNPTVATEVPQSQKSNAQLHQETISIFRKDFTDAVKDKVMLMISQKLQQFDITLDPPELGSMQVRVNLQNEQAAVSFMVQNQHAKDALEQNMHKLRDMLAEQGVDVGDANVEQQSQQSDNEGSDKSGFQQNEDIAQAEDMMEHTLSGNMINSSVNAVDYYA